MYFHLASQGLLALALASLTSASNPRLLARQNPTGGECFNPESRIRDKSYFDCPHKTNLNSDGTCPNINVVNHCTSYCEVRVRWFYGKEIPFQNSKCQASDSKCLITSSTSITYTSESSFNVGFTLGKRDDGLMDDSQDFTETTGTLRERDDPAGNALDGLKASFNFGASWSFSTASLSGTADTNNKPTNALNQCGYWTFVPYYVESCGTMSFQQYNPGISTTFHGPSPYCTGPVQTQQNFCQSTPYLDSNGKGVGETIFVATDCTSNKPLPFCYQQKTYLQQGVAQSPDLYIEYLYAHTPDQINAKDTSGPAQSSSTHACFDGKWNGNFNTDPNWVADGIGSPAPAASDITVSKGV